MQDHAQFRKKFSKMIQIQNQIQSYTMKITKSMLNLI